METRIRGVLSPKASGSITITENGNYDVVDVANAIVNVVPEEVGGITPEGSITLTSNGVYDVTMYAEAVVDVENVIPEGYVKPSGTLNVTSNGTFDVTEKKNVSVNVPIPDGYIIPSGTKSITENGSHDVSTYENVNVNVPQPSGTIEITENGEHDVANYEKANVNVVNEESANNLETLQALVDRWATSGSTRLFNGSNIKTISKSLDFSNVSQTNYFSNCHMLEEVDGINTKNVKFLNHWFSFCNNLKYLLNIDCSSATSIECICQSSPQLIEASFTNTDNITTIYSAFNGCSSLEKLELDGALIDNMQQAFYGCKKLKEVRFKKAKPSILQTCFANCDALKTIELNLINASNVSSFLMAEYLENLYLYNIKINLEIATSAGYGYHLTKESLIHTIQELIDTGSSKTLTMKSTNINKIADVYVKVISESPDENGNVKLPFEVCESTDEGAMLITNYVTLKNWALA